MDYFFLGDAELVTAFRFVGVDGISVQNSDEAMEAFRRVTESYNETAGTVLPNEGALSRSADGPGFSSGSSAGSCRVLILTEEVTDWLGEALVRWQLSDQYPLIVEVPGLMGRLPGRKTLVDSIREAIGVHI